MRKKLYIAAIASLIMQASAEGQAAPESTAPFPSASEVNMPLTMDILSGAWSLRSFVLDNGKTAPQAWADEVSGLLVYHPEGFMAVAIDGRFPNDSAGNKKFFYSGRLEVETRAVVHVVSHASDESRIGKRLVRNASLLDDTLTLMSITPEHTATLVWQRIR